MTHRFSLFAALAAGIIAITGCGDKSNEPTATADGDAPTLIIATEANYPPFNGTTPDDKIVGFDVDVMNALCAEIKAKCQIVAQDWEGLIPGLQANKFDAVIAGMSITPERAEQVDFTDPYFSNTLVWLAKNDGKFNPADIKDSVLAGQRSTTGADYITKQYDGKNGNTVKLYDTYNSAYLDLKAGRTAAVMAEKVSATDWLKQNSAEFGVVGEEIDNNDNLGIAVRKGSPLKDQLNTALAKLKESGKLAELEAASFN